MHSIKADELIDWIALSFVTGVGSRTAATLIDRLGSPSACFEAASATLESLGLKPVAIEMIRSAEPRLQAERELKGLEKLGGQALVLSDARYPALLKETYDPPIVLYYKGDLEGSFRQPPIAIVGSRHCSTYGRNVAETLARELGERGVTIISGLARGIDSAAHRGAISGGGLTVGVMGTGLDMIYPKENSKLAEKIIESGVLVTEFPLSTPPLSRNFPFRNRVISGLGFGVLLVEGAERSGSLITARMACEQGREVFAVPGNITSGKSFGPNYLIKDGAKLVQTWRDVVEELPSEIKLSILSRELERPRAEQLSIDEVAISQEERSILKLLKLDEPVHIDDLLVRSELSSGELMTALLRLEMSDRIRQLPGKCYVIVQGSGVRD
ncbi:MAG TPA: DNA-processing protein DprA [Blastocatellia bacterium]|nr:DNA-processing protein DprA [Blastocatellia bacterium]